MSKTIRMWASVVCKDGSIFEGLVDDEESYGIYLLIGGDPDRLNMFPWGNITRIVYKKA
jgi:hypothetical protein